MGEKPSLVSLVMRAIRGFWRAHVSDAKPESYGKSHLRGDHLYYLQRALHRDQYAGDFDIVCSYSRPARTSHSDVFPHVRLQARRLVGESHGNGVGSVFW